jgi:hypothetical protein
MLVVGKVYREYTFRDIYYLYLLLPNEVCFDHAFAVAIILKPSPSH